MILGFSPAAAGGGFIFFFILSPSNQFRRLGFTLSPAAKGVFLFASAVKPLLRERWQPQAVGEGKVFFVFSFFFSLGLLVFRLISLSV